MGAICGIFRIDRGTPEPERIVAMQAMMAYRGEKASSIFTSSGIGLGYCRPKALEDFSPTQSSDNRYTLIWEGRIDNLSEIDKDLEQQGESNKNTEEIILRGYASWGAELFKKLEGKFALALWDNQEKELVLARDRLGQNPLFYRQAGPEIYFASSLQAILEVCSRKAQINIPALDSYLYHSCVPQNQGIFLGIHKPAPAHFMKFKGEAKESFCYWDLDFRKKDDLEENQLLDKIEEALTSSIRKTLNENEPLNLLLDHRVESAVLAGILNRIAPGKVNTFSLKYPNQSQEEKSQIQSIVKKCSSRQEKTIIESDVLDRLPGLLWKFGEPFGDCSSLFNFALTELAGSHVQSAYSATGGDMLFAGQSLASLVMKAESYRQRWPKFFKKFFFPLALNNLIKIFRVGKGLANLQALATIGDLPAEYSYQETEGWTYHRRMGYRNDVRGKVTGRSPTRYYRDLFLSAKAERDLDRYLYALYHSRLPDQQLVSLDVTSVSQSLEIYCPYLDRQLIELAARIPGDVKLKGFEPNYLLKKLAKRYFPGVDFKDSTSGFADQIGQWLRQDWAKVLRKILLSDRFNDRRYLYPDYVEHMIEAHCAGRQNHTQRLWTLLCLEIWHLLYIDKVLKPSDSLFDYVS